MEEKNQRILEAELTIAFGWLEQIKAVVKTAYSYVDNTLEATDKSTHIILSTFDTLEVLSDMVDKRLTAVNEKIFQLTLEKEGA